MSGDLVIVGAGGHGRELFDARPHPEVVGLGGVLRRRRRREARPAGAPRAELLGDMASGWRPPRPPTRSASARPTVRRSSVAAASMPPGARLRPSCTLAPPSAPTSVWARVSCSSTACTITTNVRIGRHTHLNVGCAVQHDSIVGDFVQFSPGVYVNGDCVIGDDVFLGTGAIVTRGCTVGAGARVGAGAVVLDDVEHDTTVVGAPAQPRSQVADGGRWPAAIPGAPVDDARRLAATSGVVGAACSGRSRRRRPCSPSGPTHSRLFGPSTTWFAAATVAGGRSTGRCGGRCVLDGVGEPGDRGPARSRPRRRGLRPRRAGAAGQQPDACARCSGSRVSRLRPGAVVSLLAAPGRARAGGLGPPQAGSRAGLSGLEPLGTAGRRWRIAGRSPRT